MCHNKNINGDNIRQYKGCITLALWCDAKRMRLIRYPIHSPLQFHNISVRSIVDRMCAFSRQVETLRKVLVGMSVGSSSLYSCYTIYSNTTQFSPPSSCYCQITQVLEDCSGFKRMAQELAETMLPLRWTRQV